MFIVYHANLFINEDIQFFGLLKFPKRGLQINDKVGNYE
jgi:hypothetical protein